MSFSPTDSSLYAKLFSDPEIATIFSDTTFVQHLLRVEAALAIAQGKLAVIPQSVANTIANKALTFEPDLDQLQISIEKAGVPVIGLVAQLRSALGGEAASYVHWGATTQDIMDTALVLQIRTALSLIELKLQAIIENLAHLADTHRQTLMAGRTHSQQALPLPFGLKVAGWVAPLLRHQQRLSDLKPRLLTVQFGGAAGTLASLGSDGLAVQEALAEELNLAVLPLPWHTQRDNLAELASWLSLVSGSLAKMGQDIILMAQTEVGEIRESADLSRGGSSTMPQKSNPIICEVIIAAARANANLGGTMHQSLIQEHERATHGWQLEWLALPQMFGLTTTALNKAQFVSQNLVVNEAKMAKNVASSKGLMMAEAISFALSAHMDRATAKQLVTDAVHTALERDQHLVDVVREKTKATLDWERLKDERTYLGSSDTFIDRVLAHVESMKQEANP